MVASSSRSSNAAEPLNAAGKVSEVGRLEVPGDDLHQNGGLGGKLLDADQAQAAVAAV